MHIPSPSTSIRSVRMAIEFQLYLDWWEDAYGSGPGSVRLEIAVHFLHTVQWPHLLNPAQYPLHTKGERERESE